MTLLAESCFNIENGELPVISVSKHAYMARFCLVPVRLLSCAVGSAVGKVG